MRVLVCPCHYLFDEVTEGSEFAWAFHVGDGIGRRYPNSVVVTGAANITSAKSYRIVELQPTRQRRDLTLFNAARFNWRYSVATSRLTAAQSFDIIHHVLPFAIGSTFNLSWRLAKSGHSKLVLGPVQTPLELNDTPTAWSRAALTNSLRPILGSLSRATLKRADRIIVIDQQAKDLVREQGVAESRIAIISPGIDIGRFGFVPFADKNSTTIRVLVVGHLSKRKGVDVVIKAMAEVIKARENVRLTVIGVGPERGHLEQLARNSGIASSIDFVGQVPNSQMDSYYKGAHILVSMSQSESFGAVCLEAMASGLAVVGTEVGVFGDAIKTGLNGYLVHRGDVQDLARRITQLTDNPSLLGTFGTNSRVQAQQRYDWDNIIIPKYIELYEELVFG
jgi:glycosyltransferase involved in cell wall biosynthesis